MPALSRVLLLGILALPFVTAAAAVRLLPRRPGLALQISAVVALTFVAVVTVTPPVAISIASRSLQLSPISQLGLQLSGLAALGLVMSLGGRPGDDIRTWLPVMWLSFGGLTIALTLTSLPLALLAFAASALVWAFGLPEAERLETSEPVLRYAALVALSMPLLLAAFRLAELRLPGGQVAVETAVLALALPGFGLILGIVPLHAWTLTLASGTPRTMLLGVLGLVQTAGFALVLRTMEAYPWIVAGDYGTIILNGGALTALIGGWLALSADLDDPDDWLAYAVVANAGMLVAGIGTGHEMAGTGVVLMLLARVLALVLLALAPDSPGHEARMADAAATFTLAGTPLFAGFPGLWLILAGARSAGGFSSIGLIVGSGLLFATAVRRGLPRPGGDGTAAGRLPSPGRNRAILALTVVLIVLGVVPQLITGALADPLQHIIFQRFQQ